MDQEIIIGTVGFPIKKQQVFSQVDMVELTDARQIPPGAKAARHMKKDMPGHVAVSVQISNYFIESPPEGASLKGNPSAYGGFRISDESLSLWQRQLDFATELDAKALVLITPAHITPSSSNVEKMAAFWSTVKRNNLPIVWEPHGPWETEQARNFAQEYNLVLAVDPLRDQAPEGKLAYFRFGPFASMGSRLSVYELENILHAAQGFDTVYCVFDTQRALDDARNLKKILEDGFEDDTYEYDF